MPTPTYRVYLRLPNQQVDRNNKTNTPDLKVALAAFWTLLDQYPEPSREARAAVLSYDGKQEAYVRLDKPISADLEIEVQGEVHRRPTKVLQLTPLEAARVQRFLAELADHKVVATYRAGEDGTIKLQQSNPELVSLRYYKHKQTGVVMRTMEVLLPAKGEQE